MTGVKRIIFLAENVFSQNGGIAEKAGRTIPSEIGVRDTMRLPISGFGAEIFMNCVLGSDGILIWRH